MIRIETALEQRGQVIPVAREPRQMASPTLASNAKEAVEAKTSDRNPKSEMQEQRAPDFEETAI